MENKSYKILAVILFVLFVSFIGGATYILLDQDIKTPPLPSPSESSNQPAFSDDRNSFSAPPGALTEKNPEKSPSGMTPAFPASRQEKPELRQVPRQLTEEQKEENLREIAKMAETLPDNMWVPKNPATGYTPERGEKLRKTIELSDKIRKGSASVQEQQEYYSFKLKETTDKIELIRYIARRTEELSARSGKEYLTRRDMDTGEERIGELEQLAGEFEQKLYEIQAKTAE